MILCFYKRNSNVENLCSRFFIFIVVVVFVANMIATMIIKTMMIIIITKNVDLKNILCLPSSEGEIEIS